MATHNTPNSTKDGSFFHSSLNPTADTSIVLIHGAFGDGDDWSLVTPHLQNYHILIPDLPGHGRNTSFKPFSIQESARRIRDLIQTHASNGKAHIVGLSLGAHVGLYLAITYPDVVHSVVLSGFTALGKSSTPAWLKAWTPYLFYGEQRMENCVPRSLIRWLMDGTDLRHISSQTLTPSLCRDILSSLNEVDFSSPWPARTLIIAATKSGVVPSFDSPEQTRKLAELGREMNGDTLGVVHRGMRHPWFRQDPRLFAETVVAWIEGREIPDGFEKL